MLQSTTLGGRTGLEGADHILDPRFPAAVSSSNGEPLPCQDIDPRTANLAVGNPGKHEEDEDAADEADAPADGESDDDGEPSEEPDGTKDTGYAGCHRLSHDF